VKRRKADDAALIAAITARPDDDDGPRLVWADRLTERGDARGELITVQCELARLGPADVVRRAELRRREAALLAKDAWRASLAGLLRKARPNALVPDEFRLRRGLPEIAFTGGATFVARAAMILEKNPFCRGLEIQDRYRARTDEPWLRLAATPGLARLDTLRLHECYATDRALRTLAESPNLSGLRELRSSMCPRDEPRSSTGSPTSGG
jgi:uncharacterized protein (TIGR02996 family)